jgi:serine/threonine protein kinase
MKRDPSGSRFSFRSRDSLHCAHPKQGALMTPERWLRAKELFQAILDAPAEREALLASADPEIRDEVVSLLANAEEAGDTNRWREAAFSSAGLGSADADSLIGTTIGPYRLERVLGTGGMGTVYLALRDGSFQMRVALKVIRAGVYSQTIISRFERERQILAGLDHPHIAHLLDGGATESGSPFFVMEYVDGVPIDQYCQAQALPLRKRLALFLEVCDAVSYSHRNLIVHRDLKPGNILVTSDGTTKLLDFGIAKVLQPDALTPEDGTVTEHRALTPAYASPEQILGTRVSVASDIYSLGTILYELLTGGPPHRGTDRLKDLATLEREPIAPSASAARRDDRKLQRELQGDLDTIVLKALQFDPQRRYPAVDRLADDIRLHLTGLPISARPDTFRYRARKFVARNRLGIAAATLILLTLLGGIATTTWQAIEARRAQQRAERRFNEVRTLARSLLFDFDEKIAELSGATPAREQLVRSSLQYLESLSHEASDPAMKVEVATAYTRVGEIQGNPYFSNLGQTEDAATSYRKAIALLEPIVTSTSRDHSAVVALARAYSGLADTHYQLDQLKEAQSLYERSSRVWGRAALLAPPSPADAVSMIVTRGKQGDVWGNPAYANLGSPKQAMANYRRALSYSEAMHRRDPKNDGLARSVAETLMKMALLYSHTGDFASAVQANRRALAYAERIAASDPSNAVHQRNLALGYHIAAQAERSAGELREALTSHDRAASIMRRLMNQDRSSALYRRNLSVILSQRSATLSEMGWYQEALETADESISLARKNYDVSRSADSVLDLATSMRRSVEALLGLRRFPDAEARLGATMRTLQPFMKASQRVVTEAAINDARYAELLTATGRPAEAAQRRKRSRDVLEPLAKKGDTRALEELKRKPPAI